MKTLTRAERRRAEKMARKAGNRNVKNGTLQEGATAFAAQCLKKPFAEIKATSMMALIMKSLEDGSMTPQAVMELLNGASAETGSGDKWVHVEGGGDRETMTAALDRAAPALDRMFLNNMKGAGGEAKGTATIHSNDYMTIVDIVDCDKMEERQLLYVRNEHVNKVTEQAINYYVNFHMGNMDGAPEEYIMKLTQFVNDNAVRTSLDAVVGDGRLGIHVSGCLLAEVNGILFVFQPDDATKKFESGDPADLVLILPAFETCDLPA